MTLSRAISGGKLGQQGPVANEAASVMGRRFGDYSAVGAQCAESNLIFNWEGKDLVPEPSGRNGYQLFMGIESSPGSHRSIRELGAKTSLGIKRMSMGWARSSVRVPLECKARGGRSFWSISILEGVTFYQL